MRHHPSDPTRNQRTNEALFVLIPCKGLKSGKTRLSSRLSDKSRHAFCADLLNHTLKRSLEVVARSQIAVVTSEQEAAELAHGYSVGVIADRGKGLNAALDHARMHVLASNASVHTILVLPTDIPWINADLLLKLLCHPGEVLITPDEKLRGTNVLALRSRAIVELPFCYGEKSFTIHRSIAQQLGLIVTTVNDVCLAFDIDDEEHYARWSNASDPPRDPVRADLSRARSERSRV